MEVLSEARRGTTAELLPTLRERILEAASWVDSHFDTDDLGGSLRQLPGPGSGVFDALPHDHSSVTAVVLQRQTALRGRGVPFGSARDPQSPPSGRVLAFMPDESLSDGAAEETSGGFFDADNLPPWDTWIALVRAKGSTHQPADPNATTTYLLAWIPEPLVPELEQPLLANPEGCLRWLDDLDPALSSALLAS